MNPVSPVKRKPRLKVVLVNLDFPPIGGPGIWRMLSLAKYAALEGHKVHVVCGSESTWHSMSGESALKDIPSIVSVHRVSAAHRQHVLTWLEQRKRSAQTRVMQRLYAGLDLRVRWYWPDQAFFWALLSALRVGWLCLRERIDCVITSGPPHLSHLSGWLAKRLARVPWIIDYRDLWTDDPAQISHGPYQKRTAIWLEKRMLRAASAIVTVSPSWAETLATRARKAGSNASVRLIRNGQDLDQFASSRLTDGASPALRTCSEGKAHIHFNGAIQPGNNVTRALFNALSELLNRCTGEVPLLLTFTGIPEELDQEIRKLGLDRHIVDVGYMSQLDSVAFSLGADALLVMVKPGGVETMGTIPSKTYEALALGKHVLCMAPKENDAAKLLQEHGNCTIADPVDVAAVCAALSTLASRFGPGREQPSDANSQLELSLYSRKSQAREYLQLVDDLDAVRRKRS